MTGQLTDLKSVGVTVKISNNVNLIFFQKLEGWRLKNVDTAKNAAL